jgi:predicted RNA-binding protein with PUA-like domain
MSPRWLLKSEPDEFSILDLQRRGKEAWTGVRNYLARNYLRQMQPGEHFYFYHSSCPEPGIAGIGVVLEPAVDDATQFDSSSDYFDATATGEKPRWSSVLVGFSAFAAPLLSLQALRAAEASLENFALLARGNRLSVLPVTQSQSDTLYAMTSWQQKTQRARAKPKE